MVIRLPLMTSDRKSTRLNSSHLVISYAVFCLKKKKKTHYGAAGTKLQSAPDRGSLSGRRYPAGRVAPPHEPPLGAATARLGVVFFFFFNDTATTEIYTLSLHDALPI